MASHIVLPVRTPTEPRVLRNQLADAHRFLVAAARETVPRLCQLTPATWGSRAKREHVAFPAGDRPPLISSDATMHNFAEVVNQCATLERLLDTLVWIESMSDLREAMAVVCNPTTSSTPRKTKQPRPVNDHDLVIREPSGTFWKFEVSDVASEDDGNDKERKDLISLGWLPQKDGDRPECPSGRSFLVVSSDWAKRMSRPKRHGIGKGWFHYRPVKTDGLTLIFEVRPGRAPS